MTMEQTTTRLRKAFQYPDEGDLSDDVHEELDEEEQESLIQTLHEQNASRNTLYVRLFLSLPLISIVPYLPFLFKRSTSIVAFLSITSLLSSAWVLYFLPPGHTGFALLDTHEAPKSKAVRGRTASYSLPSGGAKGPAERYVPYLNTVLAVLLVILGLFVKLSEGSRVGMFPQATNLPVGIYAVILVAKYVMGSVVIQELEALKYNYKGA